MSDEEINPTLQWRSKDFGATVQSFSMGFSYPWRTWSEFINLSQIGVVFKYNYLYKSVKYYF